MTTTKLHVISMGAIGVVLATVGLWGHQQNRVPAGDRPAVTQADVERWKQELTNWGRWGQDDVIGTLNLITPDKRTQAEALVRGCLCRRLLVV